MDENKKIEKLSETGEQSAEMVSGGSHCIKEPMIGCDVMGNCKDCGKTTTNNAYGGYCYRCWHRRQKLGRPPTKEERAELHDQHLKQMEALNNLTKRGV